MKFPAFIVYANNYYLGFCWRKTVENKADGSIDEVQSTSLVPVLDKMAIVLKIPRPALLGYQACR